MAPKKKEPAEAGVPKTKMCDDMPKGSNIIRTDNQLFTNLGQRNIPKYMRINSYLKTCVPQKDVQSEYM